MSLVLKSVEEYKMKIKTILRRYSDKKDGPKCSQHYEKIFSNVVKANLATKTVKKYRAVIYWHAELNKVTLEKDKFRIDFPSRDSNKKQAYELEKRIKMLSNIKLISLPYREFVFHHLICGALIGYRLIEIKSITIHEESKTSIRVNIINAKSTNGRGLGYDREFVIPMRFSQYDLRDSINRLVEITNEQNDINHFLSSASVAHHRAAKKVFGADKAPTMSSMRHQFKLNLIAGGAKDLEISAMLGHISDLTHKCNYGRKTKSSGLTSKEEEEFSRGVNVSSELVKSVRRVSVKRGSFIEKRSESKKKKALGVY